MRHLVQRAAAAVVLGSVVPASLLTAQSVPDLGLSDNYQATAGQVAPDLGLGDNYDHEVADEDQELFDGMANAADPLGTGPQYQTDDPDFDDWSNSQAYFDPLRSPFVPDRLADEYDTDHGTGGDLFEPLQSSFVPDRLADDYDTGAERARGVEVDPAATAARNAQVVEQE